MVEVCRILHEIEVGPARQWLGVFTVGKAPGSHYLAAKVTPQQTKPGCIIEVWDSMDTLEEERKAKIIDFFVKAEKERHLELANQDSIQISCH